MDTTSRRKLWRWIFLLVTALLVPGASQAQEAIAFSPDTTVELSGVIFEDQEVVSDDQLGFVALVPLGTLPDATDVTAYHLMAGGDQLFSLDITADLGGGVTAAPGDVVRFDGVADILEFDASAEGIPEGVVVDGVSVHSSGDLLLSFDTTVDLGVVTVDDEDVVQFDGVAFSLFFNGSSEGVPQGLDLDALEYRSISGLLWVSFDASGSLGDVDFDDEDVLEFDSAGPSWSVVYDGSVQHAALASADLVAVPEPRGSVMLVAGVIFLGLLYRRRVR